MKSPRERMDILAAFRELGGYRGAADLCAAAGCLRSPEGKRASRWRPARV